MVLSKNLNAKKKNYHVIAGSKECFQGSTPHMLGKGRRVYEVVRNDKNEASPLLCRDSFVHMFHDPSRHPLKSA